jgi:hypothetical protein
VLNSGTWDIEDIDTLTDIKLGFPDARKSTLLVLDSNWRPHVAYADELIIKYAHKPFDVWNITTVLEHAAPINKGLVVLRLDGGSRPGLVFWQTDLSLPGLVRLARPVQSEYAFKEVSLPGGAGQIVLDWSLGFDGHEYTVQIRDDVSGLWSNAPGARPTSSTAWTGSVTSASRQIYRILASPL